MGIDFIAVYSLHCVDGLSFCMVRVCFFWIFSEGDDDLWLHVRQFHYCLMTSVHTMGISIMLTNSCSDVSSLG